MRKRRTFLPWPLQPWRLGIAALVLMVVVAMKSDARAELAKSTNRIICLPLPPAFSGSTFRFLDFIDKALYLGCQQHHGDHNQSGLRLFSWLGFFHESWANG
jgi:hypothetical protein